MNCKDCERLLEAYLNGELSTDQEHSMGIHLERCPSCQRILNRHLQQKEKQPPATTASVEKTDPDDFDEKKQRRILRRAKYYSRINIALFLLLLFFVLNIGGSFLSSYYFTRGGEDSTLFKTQRTAASITEFTFPNVTLTIGQYPPLPFLTQAGWGHSRLEIKPYFLARGSYALEKQVGREVYSPGHLNVNQFFSRVLTEWEWRDGSYQNYLYFIHPDQIHPDQQDPAGEGLLSATETWEDLEYLPRGTVAEMAVSFDRYYSLAQVHELLSPYDLEITWYAVATGQETSNEDPVRDPWRPLSAFNGVWGFSASSPLTYGLQQQSNLKETPGIRAVEKVTYHAVSPTDWGLAEDYFMETMKFLAQNESLAASIYRGPASDLRVADRLSYLEEEGIQIYGVVITGPTGELLHLQELESLRAPALGEVHLWNWFNRVFSGSLY